MDIGIPAEWSEIIDTKQLRPWDAERAFMEVAGEDQACLRQIIYSVALTPLADLDNFTSDQLLCIHSPGLCIKFSSILWLLMTFTELPSR